MLPLLLSTLRSRLSDRGRSWLENEITAMMPGRPTESVLRAFEAASLHAGRAEVKLTAEEASMVLALDPDLTLAHWTMDDAARGVLMLVLAKEAPTQFADVALAWYDNAATRAQQGWLRLLPMLPQPHRFLSTAIDACRSGNAELFEAIACENPYPTRHFPDRNFNQLVMKALSSGVALSRVVGVSRRTNPDLARMVGDYASERKAAGRSAPPEIALVLTPAKVVTAS